MMDSQTKAMARARARAQFLHLPSTILLSILTYVSSSSAQSTFSSISTTPITFQTSTSSSFSQSSSSTPPSTSTTPPPNSTPTSNPTDNNSDNNDTDNDSDRIRRSVFNYYFLIIAAAIIILGIGILFLRSRKRRKAAINRSSSQRALARDVEGFRGRFGLGGIGGGVYRAGTRTRTRNGTEEGLDERGEAPPPYVEGTKPPSIRETTSERMPEGEAVELRDMGRVVGTEPPSYDEHSMDAPTGPLSSGENVSPADIATNPPPVETAVQNDRGAGRCIGSTEITRPPVAVMASE